MEEEGEAIEGNFGFSDERCLAGCTKVVKTRGWTHKGAISTVFDEGSEGDEANMPKGAK